MLLKITICEEGNRAEYYQITNIRKVGKYYLECFLEYEQDEPSFEMHPEFEDDRKTVNHVQINGFGYEASMYFEKIEVISDLGLPIFSYENEYEEKETDSDSEEEIKAEVLE